MSRARPRPAAPGPERRPARQPRRRRDRSVAAWPGLAPPGPAPPETSQPVPWLAEARPGEARPGEARPGEARPVEARLVEARPVEARPVEAGLDQARLDDTLRALARRAETAGRRRRLARARRYLEAFEPSSPCESEVKGTTLAMVVHMEAYWCPPEHAGDFARWWHFVERYGAALAAGTLVGRGQRTRMNKLLNENQMRPSRIDDSWLIPWIPPKKAPNATSQVAFEAHPNFPATDHPHPRSPA